MREPLCCLLISVFVALALGCTRPPSNAQVKTDFLREHPTWIVIFVGVGEGDGAAAYFHIKYRRPDDSQVHEEVWQYLNTAGSWQLSHKEQIAPSLNL
jgi:hypothetical protein